MNLKSLVKIVAGTAILGFGTAASAAVYCPGDTAPTYLNPGYKNTTSETAPTAGVHTPTSWNTYVYSDQFVNNKECYWTGGNLDPDGWDDFNAGSTEFNFSNFVIKDEVEVLNDGSPNFVWTYDKPTGVGTWTITGFDASKPLYLGWHFGNGQDSPDSFIVLVNSLTGTFTFSSMDRNDKNRITSGLSNLYLFGTRTDVPEPGSLALLGAGLAGLALIRRRRRD